MASSEAYLQYVLDQLSGLEEIAYRGMMGEYLLYYRGRLAGGIYDDRLLVKPVEAARRRMPDAPLEKPYEGAKEMLLVEEVDDRAFLEALFREIWPELPGRAGKR